MKWMIVHSIVNIKTLLMPKVKSDSKTHTKQNIPPRKAKVFCIRIIKVSFLAESRRKAEGRCDRK